MGQTPASRRATTAGNGQGPEARSRRPQQQAEAGGRPVTAPPDEDEGRSRRVSNGPWTTSPVDEATRSHSVILRPDRGISLVVEIVGSSPTITGMESGSVST